MIFRRTPVKENNPVDLVILRGLTWALTFAAMLSLGQKFFWVATAFGYAHVIVGMYFSKGEFIKSKNSFPRMLLLATSLVGAYFAWKTGNVFLMILSALHHALSETYMLKYLELPETDILQKGWLSLLRFLFSFSWTFFLLGKDFPLLHPYRETHFLILTLLFFAVTLELLLSKKLSRIKKAEWMGFESILYFGILYLYLNPAIQLGFLFLLFLHCAFWLFLPLFKKPSADSFKYNQKSILLQASITGVFCYIFFAMFEGNAQQLEPFKQGIILVLYIHVLSAVVLTKFNPEWLNRFGFSAKGGSLLKVKN